MEMLIALGRLARTPAFDRARWVAIACVFFVAALFCVSVSVNSGLRVGAIVGAFGVAAAFGRRAFYIFTCAFIAAVAGVGSCVTVESCLHEKLCNGTTEIFWDPAPEPEDFACYLG